MTVGEVIFYSIFGAFMLIYIIYAIGIFRGDAFALKLCDRLTDKITKVLEKEKDEDDDEDEADDYVDYVEPEHEEDYLAYEIFCYQVYRIQGNKTYTHVFDTEKQVLDFLKKVRSEGKSRIISIEKIMRAY